MKKFKFNFELNWALFWGLLFCLLLPALAKENPFNVYKILLQSSFGSNYDLGLTLFYTTSFIFTGLAFAIPAKAGFFNIGAEGQLSISAISLCLFSLMAFNTNSFFTPVIGILVCALAGAIWSLIAQFFLKKYRVHEVIGTMMLNLIADGLVAFAVLQLIPNPESQNPESQLIPIEYRFMENDMIKKIFPDAQVNLSLLLAVAATIFVWYFFRYTRRGFDTRAVGSSPLAAQRGGVNLNQTQFWVFVMAGVSAGMVAVNEVMGSSFQYKLGFSAQFGFTGIAVALLAKNHPIKIIPSALLFACLHKGSMELDLETQYITKDFSRVLQAIIIIAVAFASFKQSEKKAGPQ